MSGEGMFGGAPLGSELFAAHRANMFAEFIHMEHVFGSNASAYIAENCAKARKRLKFHYDKAKKKAAGDSGATVRLAGKMKYVLAHLALAECYGVQIGIVSENRTFRAHALAFLSLADGEIEAIEHFTL